MNKKKTNSDLTSIKGWKNSILAAQKALGKKNIGMLSAGIAYFGVLAFFPLIAAIVALASITIQPQKIQETASEIGHLIPQDIYQLLVTQLQNAAGNVESNALIATVAIVLSIASVAGATGNMMNALNVMYGMRETRSFVQQKLISLVLTISLITVSILVVPLLVTGGDFLKWVGVPDLFIGIFSVLRWILLAFVMMVGLAVLYHFGPSRDPKAPWQWISWGAVIATAIWIVGSALFFIYLQYFANFSNSYSLFAGLIALMIWLNLSSFIVLLGAEINHRLEQRATK